MQDGGPWKWRMISSMMHTQDRKDLASGFIGVAEWLDWTVYFLVTGIVSIPTSNVCL